MIDELYWTLREVWVCEYMGCEYISIQDIYLRTSRYKHTHEYTHYYISTANMFPDKIILHPLCPTGPSSAHRAIRCYRLSCALRERWVPKRCPGEAVKLCARRSACVCVPLHFSVVISVNQKYWPEITNHFLGSSNEIAADITTRDNTKLERIQETV